MCFCGRMDDVSEKYTALSRGYMLKHCLFLQYVLDEALIIVSKLEFDREIRCSC